MIDRAFTETDVREMLEQATAFQPSTVEGRWVIASRYNSQDWEVIVEPDAALKELVVVTAYPVD